MAEKSGVQKAIEEAGGKQALADFFGISYQAVAKFERQRWLPLDRAKAASDAYGVALSELVRPDIQDAMTRN